MVFLGERCVFFTISETNILKKSKILLKGFFIGKKEAYNISGQCIHKYMQNVCNLLNKP